MYLAPFIWVVSCVLAVTNNAAVNILVQVGICFHFHFLWYLRVQLLGHLVTLCLSFLGTARLFPKATAPFYIPTSSV